MCCARRASGKSARIRIRTCGDQITGETSTRAFTALPEIVSPADGTDVRLLPGAQPTWARRFRQEPSQDSNLYLVAVTGVDSTRAHRHG